MKAKEIVKNKHPAEYNKLQHKQNNKRRDTKKERSQEHLSFNDIQRLMEHSSYKRGKGGALRQVQHI